MRSISSLVFFAAACVGALWTSPAHSFSYVMPSDESLYRQSEGVVMGQVVEELDPAFGSGLPQRRWRVKLTHVLAGPPLDGDVVVSLPGTRDDAPTRLFLPGVPSLRPGESILAFYVSDAHGALRPIQLSLGLFFETTLADAKRGYVRALDGATPVGKGANAAYELARDADRFEAWVARGARGSAFDYLATNHGKAAARDAKFSLVRDAAGIPIRWFEFDAGNVVTWQAQVGQPQGSTFSPDTAIRDAQLAWNNDPDSRINYAYNMTRIASDPGNDSSNGINAVLWDDPGNDIPGAFDPVNCTNGVLGVGGQFFNATTRVFDGNAYHQAVEGFLIIQDGVGCYFASAPGQARASEVLTHEFGHTLGFGHTCSEPGLPTCSKVPLLNDATMRGQIHDDFRGAQIREDDRRAALRVYPSPSYRHPLEGQTRSITASLSGCTGNGSRDASTSADGSVIVFQTTCNLPAKRGGVETVMLLRRDQCAKQLATKAGDPRCDEKQWIRHTKAAPLGVGIEPSITADGRFTVFVSDQPLATKALPSDWRVKRDTKQSAWVVYMQNILTNSTYAVAAGMNVGQGTQPQISPDGTAISFVTTALPENGPGEIPDATPDVFQIKPEFGVGGDPESFGEPICASCKDAPGQPAGPPASSANGVFIAYSLGDTTPGGGGASLWLRNMVLGSTNQMVPPTAGAISSTPSIDYSGNTIAFTSTAAINTGDGDVDANGKEDVFTYDACCNKFTRISRPDAELPNPTLQEPSFAPTISGDGRRLAFISRAQNLMGYTPDPGDNNTNQNVYAFDIKERIKRRFSRNASGQQSNGDSARPAMNYTGSVIVFDSAASNFDPGDANGVQDVVQMANPQAEFVVFGSGFD